MAGLLLMPCLLAADSGPGTLRTERRQKVENMTVSERNRLQHNWETFQGLERAEQVRLREIHAAVSTTPELKDVMLAYTEWLETLGPWERQELFNEPDPQKRIARIRELRASPRQTGPEPHSQKWGGPFAAARFFDWKTRDLPSLSPDDLDAVINIVRNALKLPPPAKQMLEGLDRQEQQIRILVMALAQNPRGPMGPRSSHDDVVTEEVLADAINAISDSAIREKLMENKDLKERRQLMVGIVLKTLFDNVKDDFQKIRPSDDELQTLLSQLDAGLRDELMLLPPDAMKQRLVGEYFSRHRDELPGGLQEMMRLLMFAQGGRGPGPPPPPPRGDGMGRPRFPFGSGVRRNYRRDDPADEKREEKPKQGRDFPERQ